VLAVAGVVACLVWPDGSSIPDLRGTYRGTTVNSTTNSVSQVVMVVNQDGSQLTATMKDLAFPDSNFIGSGTVTADGFVTLHFDIEGAATLDGSTPSPGRMKGIWKYDDNSSVGTWDVCTCVS
jgi:hypothetical protein